MEGIPPTDPGRVIEWGQTAGDYVKYRPGYPPGFFARLAALGAGVSGQRVLDLGTGTGNLALEFARRGCAVTAVDVSAGQIDAAAARAAAERLAVDFRVAPAEATGLPGGAFDLVSASQCWLYFDKARMIPEVKRLLAPGGRLLTCHISWLPRRDEIARRTEALVLAHNPAWSAADFAGTVPPMPDWARGHFDLTGMFWYDEAIPFTRESWRGRIRACRGVGASLPAEQVRAFDAAHAELLARTAPETFTVLHRIDAHLFSPRCETA